MKPIHDLDRPWRNGAAFPIRGHRLIVEERANLWDLAVVGAIIDNSPTT